MRNSIRLGAVLLLALSTVGCSSMIRTAMVNERASPYSMEETIKVISERAKQHGWNTSEPRKLDLSIRKHGGPTVLPVTLVELCEPHHAGKLLANDDDRWVSVFMPCTISVYEKSDGKVYVANMKAENVGSLLGGNVAEVMGNSVAAGQDAILGFLH
ncbi:MAG: DUF302 domain-containing protein [Pseudomonadota bacterium]|nr:DUF302 domain-containing protein [Pseudomonadota bacterium]MDP1903572.1 DUF302 domain-containing protein [Pseudomonadota bacterium]MDP2351433.1 DUF302 domain-containing protein [Pseudomonadota bacterium]